MMTESTCISPMHMDITLVLSASATMAESWRRLAEGETDYLLLDHLGLLARAMACTPAAVRVRIIACRDAVMDEHPFDVSPFYAIPRELHALRQFVANVRLTPGLRKRSTMEGLLRACHGEWTQAPRRRHVVAIATDCGAYLPEDPVLRADAGYAAAMHRFLPEAMPPVLDALRSRWQQGGGTIDPANALLCIIAPNIAPWNVLKGWHNTVYLRRHTESIQLCDPIRLLAGAVQRNEQGGYCLA